MVDEYHNTPHLGLAGKTPLDVWRGHYFGPKEALRPPPAAWTDDDELRIHRYPLETRSMQRYGIAIDYLFYFYETIEHLVRNYKLYPKVQVRRHPLDVRRIFFLHPVQMKWAELPCRMLGFPAASLVDLQKAKREALKTSRRPDGEMLRKLIEQREAHVEEARKKTRTAAKEEARKADEARRRKAETAAKAKGVPAVLPSPPKAASATPPPSDFVPPPDIASMLAELRDEDLEAMFDE